MTIRTFAPIIVALSLCAGSANAATISYLVEALATTSTNNVSTIDQQTVTEPGRTLDAPISLQLNANTADSSSTTTLSVNGQTGEIKLGTNDGAKQFAADEADASGEVSVRIRETFTAIGTGMVSFSAAIDGILSQNHDPQGTFNFALFEADLVVSLLGTGTMTDGLNISTASQQGGGAVTIDVDDVLETTFQVTNGATFAFDLYVRAASNMSTSAANLITEGGANFLNTVKISATAGPGMTLTASDPSFLAGTPPPQIPLPGGLPLLAGGLGLLILRRNRMAH